MAPAKPLDAFGAVLQIFGILEQRAQVERNLLTLGALEQADSRLITLAIVGTLMTKVGLSETVANVAMGLMRNAGPDGAPAVGPLYVIDGAVLVVPAKGGNVYMGLADMKTFPEADLAKRAMGAVVTTFVSAVINSRIVALLGPPAPATVDPNAPGTPNAPATPQA